MFDLVRLRLFRELAHRGTMTAVGAAFGLTSSAVSMVSAGLGVGLVPELALMFPSAKGVVVRAPAGRPLRRQIQAITRSTLGASPAVRALLSELGTKS